MDNLTKLGLTQRRTESRIKKRLRHLVQKIFTILTTCFTPRRHSLKKISHLHTSLSRSTSSSQVLEQNLLSKIAETIIASNRPIIVIRGALAEIQLEITKQQGHCLDQGQPVVKIKLSTRTQASNLSCKKYTTTQITTNRSNGALQVGHLIRKQVKRCKNRLIKVCKLI